MIDFIENIGDYFSQHYFTDDFPKKVFDKSGFVSQGKTENGEKVENHISIHNKAVGSLREKYYKFKNDFLSLKRTKDKAKLAHDFNTEILKVLGYQNGTQSYDHPVFLEDNKVIPVRYRFNKGDKPYLFVMEMLPMIKVGDNTPDGLYEQNYTYEDWESVLPESFQDYEIKPEVIKEALSELFLLPEDERPEYLIMLAGSKIFLLQFEKWKYDSYLIFDLEELFVLSQIPANKNFLALFYALLAKKQFITESESVLSSLEEDAHKASYGVTKTLKNAVIYAVENLANEAIAYKRTQLKTIEDKKQIIELIENDKFAQELKDDCLTFVYRLLFLFYAESREDLEILPVNDSTYQKGYSMEMLRDLEMIQLTTDSSRNGFFFSDSLWKLFEFLHEGREEQHGFILKPLDSPLFDNDALKHLSGIRFKNSVLQEIVLRLSLSARTRNKSRGRISYSNLGINQLGSVYESLLAYSGFFAKEDLIEVKAANDKTGKDGTFLAPKSRRDDFKEEEILKDFDHPSEDVTVNRGQFVYRLNGRDRKKSASYYTPEVLTHCTVRYTLKGILDKLREKQNIIDGELIGEYCADEILKLKILEPAMGAAAFQNEVINQLSVAYLELKEHEEIHKGRKRIVPGNYKDEVQKVKAFIAANNVYGVDLNPTAVELGKLSLWLNCMHKNMETPFFGHRLGTGNAVVGAWLKVYNKTDIIEEFPTEGTANQRKKPIPKEWWDKAPKRVQWKGKKLNRKDDQIYHFLLPDANMVPSYGIKLLKEELTDVEKKAFTDWRNDFKAPISKGEHKRLAKISRVIDHLLDEHHKQILGVIKDTTSVYPVYGQENPQVALKGYNEKERLANSRNSRTAPFYKLRMIMDYWCSLWFWDVREVASLPQRAEWYNEIESLLNIDTSSLPENAAEQDILNEFGKHTTDGTLFSDKGRIKTVIALRDTHRFFHNELEFIEVFKEGGGFDVIAGNPPWVGIEMDQTGVLSETHPEIAIRGLSASQVNKLSSQYLDETLELKNNYLSESIWAMSTKEFLGAVQCYPLLEGQRNNLYKCILVNCIDIIAKNGYCGLIHPEGIYDETKAKQIRKEVYPRLEYHFQFKNELLLFADVMNTRMYSVNVYGEKKNNIKFKSISNLFSVSTIDQSFKNRNNDILGFKRYDSVLGKWVWEITGNSTRIVEFDQKLLSKMSQVFEHKDSLSGVLPKTHNTGMANVLKGFSELKNTIGNDLDDALVGFNQVTAVNSRIIKRRPVNEEMISQNENVLSSPHFFVNNPYYKNAYLKSTSPKHFECIQLDQLPDLFHRRMNFGPDINFEKFFQENKSWSIWKSSYRILVSKMVDPGTERTLQSCIIPEGVCHTDSCISLLFKNLGKLVVSAGFMSSLPYDFYIKSAGKTNLYENTLALIPIPRFNNELKQLINLRTLRLNCLTRDYSRLWGELYNDQFKEDIPSFSGLKNNHSLEGNWNTNVPYRSYLDRRNCQIELDVLCAMAIKMSLEDLISIYLVQFPTLVKNEYDTWYDNKGNIVYTVNGQGLKGVGVERTDWEKIRGLKQGQTYEHVITKSDLYEGETVTYYAPFDKCDRVENYKTAWAHFEKVFNQENVVTV